MIEEFTLYCHPLQPKNDLASQKNLYCITVLLCFLSKLENTQNPNELIYNETIKKWLTKRKKGTENPPFLEDLL